MNIKLKKLLIGTFASSICAFSAISGIAYARTEYSTFLQIDYNSNVYGSVRYYDTGYYYAMIRPSSLNQSTNVDISVEKEIRYGGFLWRYEVDTIRNNCPISEKGVTYHYYIGRGTSGDRLFHFSTWGGRYGFTANYVTLSSGTSGS